MAECDQLRFNVHVAPDPARLATTFKLRPGPVVIEQLPRQLQPNGHLESLPARMELASRLARRELEHKMLHRTSSDDHQLSHEGPPPFFLTAALRQPKQTCHLPPQSQPGPSLAGHSVRFTEPPQCSTSGTMSRTTAEPHPAPTSEGGEVKKSDGERQQVDHTAAEIVRLRRELAKQVKRLQQTLDRNGTYCFVINSIAMDCTVCLIVGSLL